MLHLIGWKDREGELVAGLEPQPQVGEQIIYKARALEQTYVSSPQLIPTLTPVSVRTFPPNLLLSLHPTTPSSLAFFSFCLFFLRMLLLRFSH